MSNSMEFIHLEQDSILFPWGEQEVIGHFKCPICDKPIYVLEFLAVRKSTITIFIILILGMLRNFVLLPRMNVPHLSLF